MKTDIQIAQEAKMEHIRDVAARAGIMEDELSFTGNIRQSFPMNSGTGSKTGGREACPCDCDQPDACRGGKTTTSIGLGQAMAKLGKMQCLP